MSKTYGAASGDGTINSSGMTREQAMRRAQEIADKTGEPAEVYAEPAQEGDEPVAVVQPAVVSHTYYAVCNAHGPISVRLDGETREQALAAFAALDTRAAIDSASTDAEDDLEIDGADMSEDEFAAALEEAGAERVEDLSPIVNAHAGTVAHLADGWTLWSFSDDSSDFGTRVVKINSVTPVHDNPESSDPTSYVVRATVEIDGVQYETAWSGLEKDGRLTNAGWESSDQWVDARLALRVDHAVLVELGEEVLAAAVI